MHIQTNLFQTKIYKVAITYIIASKYSNCRMLQREMSFAIIRSSDNKEIQFFASSNKTSSSSQIQAMYAKPCNIYQESHEINGTLK